MNEQHRIGSFPTMVVPETGRGLVGPVDLAPYRAAVAEAAPAAS